MKKKIHYFIAHFYSDTGRLVAEEEITIEDIVDSDEARIEAESTALNMMEEFDAESFSVQ